MNRGSTSALGYTIVETLIFLAVTGGLFVSAMLLISGQQSKTEFRNAVKEFEMQLVDVANNVSSGYYTNTGDFTCSAPVNGAVTIASGVNSQGQNLGCIYIGRVMQFAVSGTNKEGYRVYGAVGRQFAANSTTKAVNTLAESLPRLIAPGTTTYTTVPPNAYEDRKFGSGVSVERVQYVQSGIDHDTGGIGFFTSFQGSNTAGSLNSGGRHLNLIVPAIGGGGTSLNQTSGDFVDNFNALTMGLPDTLINPDGGIKICLNSNSSAQFAWVTLGGGTSGRLATSMTISNGRCP